MATIEMLPVREATPVRPLGSGSGGVRVLLIGGIVSSLLYAAMLVVVPLQYPGYDSASLTVSELSAIGAPSRQLWFVLGLFWGAMYAGFGLGVWKAAGHNRRLRIAGVLILTAALFGLFWPPMHQREVLAAGDGTLTDTLHLVWAAVNAVLTLLAMGFGAAALGRRFQLYSIGTMVVLLASGLLVSQSAPGVAANAPTPWIGLWERVNIGAWLLWVAVLAVVLLGQRREVWGDAELA